MPVPARARGQRSRHRARTPPRPHHRQCTRSSSRPSKRSGRRHRSRRPPGCSAPADDRPGPDIALEPGSSAAQAAGLSGAGPGSSPEGTRQQCREDQAADDVDPGLAGGGRLRLQLGFVRRLLLEAGVTLRSRGGDHRHAEREGRAHGLARSGSDSATPSRSQRRLAVTRVGDAPKTGRDLAPPACWARSWESDRGWRCRARRSPTSPTARAHPSPLQRPGRGPRSSGSVACSGGSGD